MCFTARQAYNASFEHFGLTVHGQPVVWTVGYYDVLQNTVGGGKPKMRYHFNTTCDGAWPTTKDGFAPATEEERTSLIDGLQVGAASSALGGLVGGACRGPR